MPRSAAESTRSSVLGPARPPRARTRGLRTTVDEARTTDLRVAIWHPRSISIAPFRLEAAEE
eukprot:5022334-Pyramimonas_sp.AAC.1